MNVTGVDVREETKMETDHEEIGRFDSTAKPEKSEIAAQKSNCAEESPPAAGAMDGVDRKTQRKLLEKDFLRLSEEYVAVFNQTLGACPKGDDEPEGVKAKVIEGLIGLIGKMSACYKKYPALCKRNLGPSATAIRDESEGSTTAQSHNKKKKKRRPKKHQIKKKMLMSSRKRKQTGDGDGVGTFLNDEQCHRCVAVAYNKETKRIGYGMSGQYKKIKIHPSLWGKSLVTGRPRGTCAEFRVVNEALGKGESTSDLFLYVADVMTAKPKPRCRNCVYITREVSVLSDDLKFDGNMEKRRQV